MPISLDLLKKYKSSDVFIETGSYLGEGIDLALSAGYEEIYSIELSEKYYNYCFEKFKNNKKVKLYYGDSEKVLPEVLKLICKKSDFWLDAHYSMGDTALGEKICPLYEEIDCILQNNIFHTILIDDVRFMDTEWWNGVSKEKIISKFKNLNNKYNIYFENGYQENDILIAKVL